MQTEGKKGIAVCLKIEGRYQLPNAYGTEYASLLLCFSLGLHVISAYELNYCKGSVYVN